MTTVQTLLGTRLANWVLEPLWNSAHIEEIEITWEESLALEGRRGMHERGRGTEGHDPKPLAADPLPGGDGAADHHGRTGPA